MFDDAGSGALPWGLLRRSPESLEGNGNGDVPGSTDTSPERPPGLSSSQPGEGGPAPVLLSSSPPLRSTASGAGGDGGDGGNAALTASLLSPTTASPSCFPSPLSQLNSSLASIASITTPLQQLNVLTHELRVLHAQTTRDARAVADLRAKLALAPPPPPPPSSPTLPSSTQRSTNRSSSGTPIDVVASRKNELVAEVSEHVERLANADVLNQVAVLAAQDEVDSSAEALRVALQQRDAQHDLLNVINEQWFTYGSSKADTPGDHFKRVGEEIRLQNQLREHYHEALSVGTSIASTVSLERATRAAQLSDNLHKYDSEHEQGRVQLNDLRAFETNHKHVLVEQTRELTDAQHRAAALTAELEESTSSEKTVKSELQKLRRALSIGDKDLEELEAAQQDLQTQLSKEKERFADSNAERERAEQDLHAVQAEQRVAEEKLACAKQSVAALASKHQTELDDARDQAGEEEAAHVREGDERTQELEEVKHAYSKTQTTLEQIESEMRQTHDKLQAELESLGVILDNDGSFDTVSLLSELRGGVLTRIGDLEREIRSLERKLATHANASKSFASTIKMQQNRIAHLGEKLARARIQDDWEDNSREMFGTDDADDISVIIDLHDDGTESGSVASRASPIQTNSPMFPMEQKEPEEVAVKRLEHAVAHLTADLGTVRRRLDEAKVAATRSLLRTWESNDAVKGCTRCGVAFSWKEWRYHCRSCGRIFCSPCTSKRMRTTFHRRPQRSCQECYNDTLRLQKIRELQRQLAAPRRNVVGAADTVEPPFEVVNDAAPHCYSVACRSGMGVHCYSPACPYASCAVDPTEQRRVNFAKLALRIKEELVQREIKILCISTVSDLYDLTTKFSIPTHRWSELCYFILEGRHEHKCMRDAFVEFKACSSSSELDDVRRNLLEGDSKFSGGNRELIRACFYTRLNNLVHVGR